MAYRIQVPLNSPAYDSYVRDGWQETSVEGQWATLQMQELEVSTFPDVVPAEERRRDPYSVWSF